jgi:hypothetical protein
MSKHLKITAALFTLIFLSSFTFSNKEEPIGTYGVTGSDPSQIKLSINADHTFSYQDYSNSKQPVNVAGKWILKGKKVVLIGSNSEQNFHHVWSFTQNGQIAKSRKGMCFYRICKISS